MKRVGEKRNKHRRHSNPTSAACERSNSTSAIVCAPLLPLLPTTNLHSMAKSTPAMMQMISHIQCMDTIDINTLLEWFTDIPGGGHCNPGTPLWNPLCFWLPVQHPCGNLKQILLICHALYIAGSPNMSHPYENSTTWRRSLEHVK